MKHVSDAKTEAQSAKDVANKTEETALLAVLTAKKTTKEFTANATQNVAIEAYKAEMIAKATIRAEEAMYAAEKAATEAKVANREARAAVEAETREEVEAAVRAAKKANERAEKAAEVVNYQTFVDFFHEIPKGYQVMNQYQIPTNLLWENDN